MGKEVILKLHASEVQLVKRFLLKAGLEENDPDDRDFIAETIGKITCQFENHKY
jgi:hypothetical protein